VDPVLVQCNADLQWLAEQGVTVSRYNLSQQPQSFAANPAVLKELETGMERLPLTLIDGRIVATGAYLSRAQLVQKLDLAPSTNPTTADPFRVQVNSVGCKPGSGCC
ncbi:arsenic metallochaperone ArsD family protein, partial [uncultured Thiocystis sp.]|uniref:arsenic metallochaperone ArsD family protein n=1 Tax=uncultured Thiocystis sp. TaxID=1202134 RepID=UPI0025DCAC81